MKIYVIGIPHTQATTAFSTCAFTIKTRHLCRMMHDRGHHVVFLGVDGSDPVCSEIVPVMTEERRNSIYGRPSTKFYEIDRDGEKAFYLNDYANAVSRELTNRVSVDPWTEIICLPWGTGHFNCIKDVPQKQFYVESGVGYRNTFSKYRVYESYAWMHFIWGRDGRADGNGWTECVIPNSFDVDQFKFVDRPDKEDYLLFMGRLNDDKGVRIAIDTARMAGRKIKIVGQGNPERFLRGNHHAEYHPPVGPSERNALMGGAAAFFCPTHYTEPFGGVAVEAQMCGTPVICTDWGAFTETVIHSLTGYRCTTLEQFAWAAKNIDTIKPRNCRDWAVANFSLEKAGEMYEEYFNQLLTMSNKAGGFYAKNEARKNLNFKVKRYPCP